jgi:hypothetical protein
MAVFVARLIGIAAVRANQSFIDKSIRLLR